MGRGTQQCRVKGSITQWMQKDLECFGDKPSSRQDSLPVSLLAQVRMGAADTGV